VPQRNPVLMHVAVGADALDDETTRSRGSGLSFPLLADICTHHAFDHNRGTTGQDLSGQHRGCGREFPSQLGRQRRLASTLKP